MRAGTRRAVRAGIAVVLATLGTLACGSPRGVMESAPRPRTTVGDAQWIDVTATLDPATTPVYEGDAPMKFDFLHDMRKGEGFTLSVLSLGAHSGTHIDAPMHFVRDGVSIDRVSLEPLMGPARVIEIADAVQAIDAAELNRHTWRGAKRLLFKTRSSGRGWMTSSSRECCSIGWAPATMTSSCCR